MINEQIVDESIDVAVRIGSLTTSAILKGLDIILKKFENNTNEKTPEVPATAPGEEKPELKEGKQTLKELHKHNEGLETMELKDPNLRDLYKEMKKNDIDFSCVKDGKGKYTLFFKCKNATEMTNAFKKYTEKTIAKAEKREEKKTARDEKRTERAEQKSIQQELKQAKKEAKVLDKGKNKVKNRSKGAIDI